MVLVGSIGMGAVIGNLKEYSGVSEMRFNAEKMLQRHEADIAIRLQRRMTLPLDGSENVDERIRK